MTRPGMLGGGRKRRGGLVGFGVIAETGHLPAYAGCDDLSIVAVADICPARREAAQRAMPQARIYDSHEALLASEARDLDFLDVTTPPYAHAEIARAALASGLHVMCEKPLCTNVEDARTLIDAAERARRVLFPVENYRHAPVIVAVRQVLDTGMIGSVQQVTLSTFRNTHARGVPEWNEDWRRQQRYAGGGIMMDHGSHTLYLAFEWLKSYPTSVTARMRTAPGMDTEDTVVGTLTFPTGIAAVHLTWTAGIRKVIYTIHGERGAIRVEDDDIQVAVMGEQPRSGQTAWELQTKKVSSQWMDASHVGWFRSMFGDFARAIDQKDIVGRSAENALRCIEVISSAYQSNRDASRERSVHHMG